MEGENVIEAGEVVPVVPIEVAPQDLDYVGPGGRLRVVKPGEPAVVFDGPEGMGRIVEVAPVEVAPKKRGRPPKAPKPRRADDFYPTPDWQGRAGLDLLRREVDVFWRGSGQGSDVTIVDPGAGEGHLLLLAHAAGFQVHGIEKDVERAARCRASIGSVEHVVTADFLAGGGMPHGAVVAFLMNPPFSDWEEFVREAFRSDPVAVVALGRAALLGSKGRRAFWSDFEADMYQHTSRASYTGDGETDKYDCAWFVLRRRKPGGNRARIGEVFRLDGYNPAGQLEVPGAG